MPGTSDARRIRRTPTLYAQSDTDAVLQIIPITSVANNIHVNEECPFIEISDSIPRMLTHEESLAGQQSDISINRVMDLHKSVKKKGSLLAGRHGLPLLSVTAGNKPE